MKFSLLSSLVIAALSVAFVQPTEAAINVSAGTLIKGPSETVYYYGPNERRYVFPNFKTFSSWYSDFSGVVTVSASDLASIPLGGNVTYRPGVRLVKITTDPKVYAVASNGTLRWVQTEAVASALYGADWNKKVDDVPDEFFVNYSVGAAITNASDFSPTQQLNAAVNIMTDKRLSGEPAPTPTPNPTPTPTPPIPSAYLQFTTSKSSVQAGDVVTLTASNSDPVGIQSLELFFDGTLVKTCASASCSVEVPIPTSGTKASYIVETRSTKVNANVETRSLTLTVTSDTSNLVLITVGQETIMPNQAASVIVEADLSIAVRRIDISVGGTIVKACVNSGRQCRWSDYLEGATLNSTHTVFAIVTDPLGRTYTSKKMIITIGTNDSPGVTITPAKTQIYTGEAVDITVSASDNDGVASLDILYNGTVLKHCTGPAACTVTTGPWQTAGATLHFTGRATDTKGIVGSAETTQSVSVVAH